jgi:hypothetical protein
MLPGLASALERRRRYVDELSETAVGEGTGSVASATGATQSKFAGETFVDRSETGFTGLVNQGATCYLNSFLQMLYMTPEFRKALFGACAGEWRWVCTRAEALWQRARRAWSVSAWGCGGVVVYGAGGAGVVIRLRASTETQARRR